MFFGVIKSSVMFVKRTYWGVGNKYLLLNFRKLTIAKWRNIYSAANTVVYRNQLVGEGLARYVR